jgi:acetone carboxylase gamma subunit
MDCTCEGCVCEHYRRREIAHPQTEVKDNLLLETRLWFCPDCGEKWSTTTKLGDVEGITLQVDLKS